MRSLEVEAYGERNQTSVGLKSNQRRSKLNRIQPTYQLDLTTPGISPFSASERKQRRQTPNLRRNARGRPQSWQRLCWRDLNFGVFASLTRFAVVDIIHSQSYSKLRVFGDLPAENECGPNLEPEAPDLRSSTSNVRPQTLRLEIYAPTRNGKPKAFSRVRAPLSSFAVVTMVTFIPLILSTFA
jgi:hypothetical protein